MSFIEGYLLQEMSEVPLYNALFSVLPLISSEERLLLVELFSGDVNCPSQFNELKCGVT